MPLTHSTSTLPRISVITVVKNGKPFVEQTLGSVTGQRYAKLEYIVIDGGSTDGTVDVIKLYASGIAKWISENDEGIADAFNKGLALATGDYILILNADDALATPDVLQNIAQEIIGNGSPAILYGDYDILSRSTGELISHGRVNFSPKKLIYGQVLPHPCLFAARDYFGKYGRFDQNFKIAMDYEWLLRGALNERIVHVPMLTTNIRDGGISTLDQPRVTEEIIRALRKNGYFPNKFSEYKIRGYFFSRAILRKLLARIGLYVAFVWLRNRLKSTLYNRPNANN